MKSDMTITMDIIRLLCIIRVVIPLMLPIRNQIGIPQRLHFAGLVGEKKQLRRLKNGMVWTYS